MKYVIYIIFVHITSEIGSCIILEIILNIDILIYSKGIQKLPEARKNQLKAFTRKCFKAGKQRDGKPWIPAQMNDDLLRQLLVCVCVSLEQWMVWLSQKIQNMYVGVNGLDSAET